MLSTGSSLEGRWCVSAMLEERMFGGECCSVAATQVPVTHMSVAVSGDFINDLNVVS